jgi:hypothetical protein
MPERPVNIESVRAWPPKVRAEVRAVLRRGLSLTSPPALLGAVQEITDVIDQADAEAVASRG